MSLDFPYALWSPPFIFVYSPLPTSKTLCFEKEPFGLLGNSEGSLGYRRRGETSSEPKSIAYGRWSRYPSLARSHERSVSMSTTHLPHCIEISTARLDAAVELALSAQERDRSNDTR